MVIPSSLTQVAQIAVQAIDASATISAGGTGGASVFAGVVVSEKGQPFELINVNRKNWQTKLGKPYHPSKGAIADPLRQVGDAVLGGDGYVVRVVAADAKYPVLTARLAPVVKAVKATKEAEGKQAEPLAAPTAQMNTSAVVFGTTPPLAAGDLFAIYPKDGDVSGRKIEMLPIEGKDGFFTLNLYEIDRLGTSFLQESHEVSFDIEAVDDMGQSAYIENRLGAGSAALAITIKAGADLSAFPGATLSAFTGGTLGDQNEIGAEQVAKAIAVLRSAMVGYTAILGLGVYDTDSLAALAEVAEARRIDAFLDVPPSQNYAGAVSFMEGMNINNHYAAWYHFPYSAKDPYYSGGRAVWGISGIAFQAKAMGVAKVSGSVGGWHYSPAGEERGVINRRECQPLAGIGELDEEAFYKARINKLGLTGSGLLMIDDAITSRTTNDYLRFQHVSSVMSAIARDFYALARQIKHSPDGLTYDGLHKGMTDVLDGFVTSGALVKPRNPDEDGESPYVLHVEQDEFDQWTVAWNVCVTGTARRILGTPGLIR